MEKSPLTVIQDHLMTTSAFLHVTPRTFETADGTTTPQRSIRGNFETMDKPHIQAVAISISMCSNVS